MFWCSSGIVGSTAVMNNVKVLLNLEGMEESRSEGAVLLLKGTDSILWLYT